MKQSADRELQNESSIFGSEKNKLDAWDSIISDTRANGDSGSYLKKRVDQNRRTYIHEET